MESSFDKARSVVSQLEQPHSYKGAIPNESSLPFSLQAVTGYKSLRVSAGAGPEPINSNGFIVANFRNGYNDIAVYGSTPAISMPPATVNMFGINAAVTPRWNFTKQAMLPISPGLERAFCIGQLSSASLEVSSSTVSTTSASLSGTVVAAAITDFQNLAEWSFTEVESLKMTPMDGLIGKELSKPTRVWLGPDVITSPQPIDTFASYSATSEHVIDSKVHNPITNGTIGCLVRCNIGNLPSTPDLFYTSKNLPPNTTITVNAEIANVATSTVGITILGVWIRAPVDPSTPLVVVTESVQISVSTSSTADVYHTGDFTFGTNSTHLKDGFTLAAVVLNTTAGGFRKSTWRYNNVYSPKNYGGWRLIGWRDAGVGQALEVEYKGSVTALPSDSNSNYMKADPLNSVDPVTWFRVRNLFATGALRRVAWNSGMQGGQSFEMGIFKDFGHGLGGHAQRFFGDVGQGIDDLFGFKGHTVPKYSMAGSSSQGGSILAPLIEAGPMGMLEMATNRLF